MTNPNSSAQRSFAAEPYDSVAAVLASKQITADLVGQTVHTKDGAAFKVEPGGGTWDIKHPISNIGLSIVPVNGVITIAAANAVGDGVADDADALSVAIRAAIRHGARLVGAPGKIYRYATDKTVALLPGVNLDFDLCGGELISDNASLMLGGTPTPFLVTSFTTAPKRGDAKITLASVAGVSVGDLIYVVHASKQNGINIQHTYLVAELDGNDVYIEGCVVADINDAQTTASGDTGSIVVNVMKVASKVTISNLKLRAKDTTGTHSPLTIAGVRDVSIQGATLEGHSRMQVQIMYFGRANINAVNAKDFGYTIKDSGYENLPTSPEGLSFGYGILFSRGWVAQVNGGIGSHGWHSIDFARGVMFGLVSNAFFGRNSYGISTHESAWYLKVSNCLFDGGLGVGGGRNAYTHLEGNTFVTPMSHAVAYSSIVEVIAKNNIFDLRLQKSGQHAMFQGGAGSVPPAFMSAGFGKVFEFSGNTLLGGSCQVGFNEASASENPGRLVVRGNALSDLAHYSAVFVANETVLADNTFGTLPQFAFVVHLKGSPAITVSGNKHDHTGAAPSGGAMFYLHSASSSSTPDIDFINNVGKTQHLIRFNVALTIRNVINNVASHGRLASNEGTITNAIRNIYVGTLVSNTTVINSVDNTSITP